MKATEDTVPTSWLVFLAIVIWLLVLSRAFAGPGSVKTNVTVIADYDTNSISPDLVFNLYSSTNIALTTSSWPILTNSAWSNWFSSGTNIQVILPITPGPHFYAMTASNQFGESFFSNVATGIVAVAGSNLRIKPGP